MVSSASSMTAVSVISSSRQNAGSSVSSKHGGDDGDDVAALKLARRQIDAHLERPQGRELRLPFFGLLASLAQNPLADTQNHAALFGDGDEIDRRNDAFVGMIPAHQGFHADDAVAAQIHERLVIQAQLLPFHRLAQLDFELQTAQSAAALILVSKTS